jgi:hypothetical protein
MSIIFIPFNGVIKWYMENVALHLRGVIDLKVFQMTINLIIFDELHGYIYRCFVMLMLTVGHIKDCSKWLSLEQ